MAKITEDYVSSETAKLLKEKGFDHSCEYQYINCSSGHPFLTDIRDDAGCYYKNSEIGEDEYSAPTLQMVMKYLRKKHKLCIVSMPVVTDDDGDGGCLWNFVISRKLKPLYESEHLYESPETAFNDAIKYCLENLI